MISFYVKTFRNSFNHRPIEARYINIPHVLIPFYGGFIDFV